MGGLAKTWVLRERKNETETRPMGVSCVKKHSLRFGSTLPLIVVKELSTTLELKTNRMKGTLCGLGWVYVTNGGGGGAEDDADGGDANHDAGTRTYRMKGTSCGLGWIYVIDGGGGGANHDT